MSEAVVEARGEDPEDGPSRETVSEYSDIYRGREWKEAEALAFAASRPVRLVVIAGEAKGGKTTLLTTLYDMFQAAPVAGQNFAGSFTLPGLENRCHHARLESDNLVPDPPRTPYKGPNPFYLHLRTSLLERPRDATDFLFTDVSGEMFEHAIDSEKECRELTFLHRANDFVLLLDGEKAVREGKWSMIQNARTLLQSCLDCDMLPKFCTVGVIWSKFDYFEAAPVKAQDEHRKFREEVEADFRTRFSHRVGSLRFRTIAARPRRKPDMGFGHGVGELLTEWLETSLLSQPMKLTPATPVGARESELYAVRRPAPSTS